MLLHIGATRRIRLNTLMLSCVAVVTRDVVVNFYFWERFPRPRSQQRGRLRPHARRVAVLGVSAGRGRPLPLRRSGVSPPENFGRFLMPNPAFGGNLGQKIKLIEGQPNEYDVICRNASVLAFQLWPAIFAGAPFRLQNICRNGVPPRSCSTTPMELYYSPACYLCSRRRRECLCPERRWRWQCASARPPSQASGSVRNAA